MNFLLLNFIIALLFTAITSFLVSLLILMKSPDKASKKYAYLGFAVVFWTFFDFFAALADSPEKYIIFSRLLMCGVWLIPVFWVHFVVDFLNLKNKKWVVKTAYIFGVFSVAMNFSPYMFFEPRSVGFLKLWIRPGLIYHFSTILFVIFAAYGVYEMFKAYKISKGVKHNQLAYLFWSTVMGFAGGSTNFFYAYNIYIPIIQPFATYLVGIYPIIVAYAILKHHLMDINLVIKKAFFYSSGIALISGIIFGISFLNSWFAENMPGFKPWMIPLFAGIVAFVVGNLFWRKSKEVDKLKYEFITVAAHKLRTPLTEVKWGLSAMKDKSTAESERDKLVSEMDSANTRLIALTDELLSIAKTEAGQYQYSFQLVDFEKMVRSAVNDFQHQFKEKGIKLSYHYDKDLLKVNADKIRMSLVIQILMENAINYTKDKIDISIKKDRNDILFSVKDNGIGINKEDLPHIFSKFYRSHDAYLTETEGEGIGLYLAKSIIDKHNAKIGVQSEGKDKGSEFWVRVKIS